MPETPQKPSRIQAVVFDLDGLLFNTEELYQHTGAEMLRRRGHTLTQELLDDMMGRPSAVALQIMIDRHGLDCEVEDLRRETDEIMETLFDTRLAPMPGAAALLDDLEQAGIPRAVATSSRRDFVDAVLGRFGFHRRFAFILCEEDVRHGKPHPEIYELAARKFGATPAEMMVLEDSPNGCRSAVAAGAFVVAAPGPQHRGEPFPGVTLICDSLKDVRIRQALGLA